MEIIERRINERNTVIKNAEEYANSLNFKCSVFLIGSYARGDFNLWSDIDIIIIGCFTGNPVQRLKILDFPAGYEVIPLTLNEVIKMKNKNNKLIADAFNEGVLLRDDFNIMNTVN
ncbi:nucleotidyltransferase domain-containing protein [Ferroplasma sp.]|uniref:nucleotidyltransferase domain-containing protein n=1 Tax=Ferroplasma sp. TaxID=2591003 RepID=UPI00307E3D4B